MRYTTETDLFCSAQLVLPGGTDALLLGGDNWIASKGATNNRGNNESLIFRNQATPSLQAGRDMNLRRWYATAITLPNGETYIQGGEDGTDRAEIRSTEGTFRLLDFQLVGADLLVPAQFRGA